MSKLNNKRKKVVAYGWCWMFDEKSGMWWAFHCDWHWSAVWFPFKTKRAMINKLYGCSLPHKKRDLVVKFWTDEEGEK